MVGGVTTSRGQARFPDRDVGTLEQSRRARDLRRIGLVVLLAVVVAALAGFLGPRERTTSARTDTGLAVEVRHPTVVRPGMEVDVTLAVGVPGGAEELVVEVDHELFERIGIELAVPAPDTEEALDGRVRMRFPVADGTEDVTLLLSGRLPTRAQKGPVTVSMRVARGDDDGDSVPLEFRTWVLP
jgi:hypothetical protein